MDKGKSMQLVNLSRMLNDLSSREKYSFIVDPDLFKLEWWEINYARNRISI